MASPDIFADPPDTRLLRVLFPPGEGFRHKMGVQRREFREFYAATAAGTSIQRDKTALLADDPTRYMVASTGGWSAFHEFAAMLGVSDVAGAADAPRWLDATRNLSLRVEPDFLLLLPPDWRLVWASVAFPSRWSLEGELHRPLHEIHAAVPGLNAELGRKIDTFFARMSPGEGWGRANWGLNASASRNQHPCLTLPTLTADTPPDETFVRVEDQHLLKLPGTGAMAFGIRVLSFRLSEVAHDEAVAAALRERLKTMPPDVAEYKGLARFLAAKT